MKPFILGLTGSIGMGKSATAQIFTNLGVPVWDADATVHDLYFGDTPATEGIRKLVPEAVTKQGVDRSILKQKISKTPELLKQIEAIVHPLVALNRQEFLQRATDNNTALVVFDIPLLLENNNDNYCNAVMVVTTSAEEQKRRVLERPGMTEENFRFIQSRQVPDTDKRAAADYLLETTTPEVAEEFVRNLVAKLTKGRLHA